MKKIMAAVMAGMFLLGSGFGVLAAGSYYTEQIDNAAQAQQAALIELHDDRRELMEQQIHRDTITITNQEIERLQTESRAYMEQQLEAAIRSEQQQRTQERAEEVRRHTDQKLEELKRWIDDLIAGKLSRG